MYRNEFFMEEGSSTLDEAIEDQPEKPKKEKPVKKSDLDVVKNGRRRKNLYVSFITYCKSYNNKNSFGSVFDKDAFDTVYSFVPKEMRYFYRLANPLLCVLSGELTFFQLSDLKRINSQNKKLNEILIFAATPEDMRVFSNKDKKVYLAVEENDEIVLKKPLADSFDLYIQDMIKHGDYLNGPDVDLTKDENAMNNVDSYKGDVEESVEYTTEEYVSGIIQIMEWIDSIESENVFEESVENKLIKIEQQVPIIKDRYQKVLQDNQARKDPYKDEDIKNLEFLYGRTEYNLEDNIRRCKKTPTEYNYRKVLNAYKAVNTILKNYDDDDEVIQEAKYDFTLSKEEIYKKVENFKHTYNFRPSGKNPNVGVITVRGNNYNIDLDIENPYVSVHNAITTTRDGRQERIRRQNMAIGANYDMKVIQEQLTKNGKTTLPNGVIIRSIKELEPFIVLDMDYFKLPPDKALPILMHEIGHIRYQMSGGHQGNMDSQRQKAAIKMGINPLNADMGFIHGTPWHEVEADAYAAKITGVKEMMESLKALSALWRKEDYDRYIKGGITGNNDWYNRKKELYKNFTENIDKYYTNYSNLMKSYNKALNTVKEYNKNPSKKDGVVAKITEESTESVRMYMEDLLGLSFKPGFPVPVLSKNEFQRRAIRNMKIKPDNFFKRLINLIRALFRMAKQFIKDVIENHARKKMMNKVANMEPYNTYESVQQLNDYFDHILSICNT